MSRKRIDMSKDSTAILLPQEALDQLGISAGDEVDLSVMDRWPNRSQVVLQGRPTNEAGGNRKTSFVW